MLFSIVYCVAWVNWNRKFIKFVLWSNDLLRSVKKILEHVQIFMFQSFRQFPSSFIRSSISITRNLKSTLRKQMFRFTFSTFQSHFKMIFIWGELLCSYLRWICIQFPLRDHHWLRKFLFATRSSGKRENFSS